jgi:hypothetical protein
MDTWCCRFLQLEKLEIITYYLCNPKGLTPQSLKVFEAIKKSDLLHEYILIGGIAPSLQIYNRLSEDLDFCKWQDNQKILHF